MLRQDELAIIKVISTLQMSPAFLNEQRLAMARRKKPAVAAGRRRTIYGSGTRASQHPAGNRNANELACSGESMVPANRPPALGTGSAALPVNSSVTGDQTAVGRRQPVPSEGGATYAAVLVGPIPRLSQVDRSSTQPWNRAHPNPVSHPRQATRAFLPTSPGL
jgi:hypothetical protein